MNRLFWGLLLCLLDYNVAAGSAVFDLLPDFVGYFLLMKGMEELAGENRYFDRGRHWAFGLMIVSAILFIANLMNPASVVRVALWTVDLICLVVLLVLIRTIIYGVARLEQDHDLTLRGDLMKTMWLILIVIYPISGLVSWLPLVGDICAMASIVVGALFLSVFWECRKTYNASMK